MDYLMISEIQHFVFCPRQWALIHIERIWKDNVMTFRGHKFHEKVDDPYIFEKRGGRVISRSLPLISHELSLKGISDCVEFHMRDDDLGIKIKNRKGSYDVIPIEYKVGDVKKDRSDVSQLCVQAICLEEMFDIKIKKGYLYYGKLRRRVEVNFTDELRENVKELVSKMRYYFENGITPKPSYRKQCINCSLYDICLPKLNCSYSKVKNYIDSYVEDI